MHFGVERDNRFPIALTRKVVHKVHEAKNMHSSAATGFFLDTCGFADMLMIEAGPDASLES